MYARTLVLAAALIGAQVLGFSSDGRAELPSTPPIVFDVGHGEIFNPVGDGAGQLSRFYAACSHVAPVSTYDGPITHKSLEGVGVYVLAGPMKELAPQEIIALARFVQGGGGLLVALHVSSPAARLTELFGIVVTNYVVSEPEGRLDDQGQAFQVTRFAPHPVTMGLRSMGVWGTWGLKAEAPAEVVVMTTDHAFVDKDRDGAAGPEEPVAEFGIVAVAHAGHGRVVVVADDAPFIDTYLGREDNASFAANAMAWLAAGGSRGGGGPAH